jgi:hypothetical protein
MKDMVRRDVDHVIKWDISVALRTTPCIEQIENNVTSLGWALDRVERIGHCYFRNCTYS